MSEKRKVVVYGANWCSDCRRSKKYLGEQRIHYEWRDIELETSESKEAYDFVLAANEKMYGKPMKKIPVIQIVEGQSEHLLIEPSNVELAKALGLATEAASTFYDVIIIGGGPAGLTAALYLARDDYEVLVIERSTIGGQAFITNRLDNYPGFPEGITGEVFAENLKKQVKKFGVEILFPYDVVDISPCHDVKDGGSFDRCAHKKVVTSDGTELFCNAVLVATGSNYRELVVPGSDDLAGISIHYCATCDGAFYKGKELFVIGGGDSAFEESLYLKEKFATKVTIIVRGEKPSASPILQEKVGDKEGIEIITHAEVVELKGENQLKSVMVRHIDTGELKEYSPDGLFVFIGLKPNTKFVAGTIKTDDRGFITTNIGMQTSVMGVFAAGDCRAGATNQAISAAGEGASAAIAIREFLKRTG